MTAADKRIFDDRPAHDATSVAGEATLANNLRVVTVHRDRGPYRILYVAGRPNWEFKFIRRALTSDAEIELVGLLRSLTRNPNSASVIAA